MAISADLLRYDFDGIHALATRLDAVRANLERLLGEFQASNASLDGTSSGDGSDTRAVTALKLQQTKAEVTAVCGATPPKMRAAADAMRAAELRHAAQIGG
ncbi:hypothetical protein [Mycolicibacterium sp. XJ870]